MCPVPPLPPPTAGTAVRAALLAVAAGRVLRGARRAPPLAPVDDRLDPASVTIVVPARDEAERIGPCLESLAAQGAPVVVVDDGSTDDTAAVARSHGARVVDAGPLPDGWAGKAHALHVGLGAVDTPVVLTVDADCRLAPGAVAALVAALDGHVLATAALAVDAPEPAGRAVHASMLASLLYRLGPPGVPARRPERTMANGQCMVIDRAAVLDRGGFGPVAGNLIEDVAVARRLAAGGSSVAFADGTRLGHVQGYGGAIATLRGWGRSLALREVTSVAWTVADLAVVWSAMALPLPRLAVRRGDAIDAAAFALRAGVVAATAGAFRRRGPVLLLAPLADLVVAVRLTTGAVRPSRSWRGRDYS